ncbi:Acetyl xylan esterase (AXE1) [Pirellula sp. SH-Sr6A]|nr:Acetyl xylan esterase (AXE1) [Pirellula sp. SH-Sr6A]
MDTELYAPPNPIYPDRLALSSLRELAVLPASTEPAKFAVCRKSYSCFAASRGIDQKLVRSGLLKRDRFRGLDGFLLTCISLLFCLEALLQRTDAQSLDARTYEMDTTQWQRANSDRLKSPTGWLALAAHLWLDHHWMDIGGDPSFPGHLGSDAPSDLHVQAMTIENEVRVRTRSQHTLKMQQSTRANSADAIAESESSIRDLPAMESASLKLPLGLDADCPDVLILADRYRLQAVRRNGRVALRVRDPESSTIQEFPGKFWFPIDAYYRVSATFTPYPESKWVTQANSKGEQAGVEQVGEIAFELDGLSVQWIVQAESDDEHLIVFRDAMCGQGAYPACRFLNFSVPDLHGKAEGTVQLDFNRSYNPPCAFSPHTLCPLPPDSNKVNFAIPVGERYATRNERLQRMQKVMGKLPEPSRIVPLDVEWGERKSMDGYDRIHLTYASEAGDRVPAWLLIPHGVQRAPAMLCLHQTIAIGKDEPVGLGEQESKRQALHLVRRGYVCLAPDYPSFGEYRFDFQRAFLEGRFESGTMKSIWNNMRAVDLLCSLPEVDAERIGVIGHSLGGHNSLFTAAFDSRLKVAVTSCGFCSFRKYYGGNLKGWTSDRYMPKIASVYQNDPQRVPFDFDDVLISIFPRAIYVMAPLHDANFDVTGVKDVLAKVEPVYEQANAREKLKAAFPDAAHEWPADQRDAAYAFIDAILKR